MIHRIIFSGLFAANVVFVNAGTETFVDNFDREAVPETANASLIGPAYENSSGKLWELKDGHLLYSGANSVARISLINKSVETKTDAESSGFLVEASVRLPAEELGGIVFNCQDAQNFYYLAFQSDSRNWELAAVVGGEWVHVAGGVTANEPFLPDSDYTLSVEYSPKTEEYTCKIADSSDNVAIAPAPVPKSGMPGEFNNGYGGVFGYSTTENAAVFDNLKIVPNDPASVQDHTK